MRPRYFLFLVSLVVLAVGGYIFIRHSEGKRREMTASKLRHIALACSMREAIRKDGVPPAITDNSGKPLLSWRVALLPYMENVSLYDQFRLDEPWDSPHNLKLASANPYRSPNVKEQHKTSYLAVLNSGAGGEGVSVQVIADAGTAHSVVWTAPEDLQLTDAQEKLLTAYTHIPGICRGGAPVVRVNGREPIFRWFSPNELSELGDFANDNLAR